MRTSKVLALGALFCPLVWSAPAGAEVADALAPAASGEALPEEVAGEASESEPWEEPAPAGPDDSPAPAVAPALDGPAPELLPLERASTDAPQLGAVGYDSEGRQGRLHIVVRRDTLWDISNAYLGSAWVWPSIWRDNQNVENPHRIYPGDRIWITRTEMRRVTPEEAESFLAGAAAPEPLPAAPAPAAPAPVPALAVVPDARPTFRVSSLEAAGLISEAALQSSASVVDAIPNRVMLGQGDEVYIGLGEGDVEAGDQFTIFRATEKVYDPESGRLLGHHVDVRGWLEVIEVDSESSLAVLRRSQSEIERGDRIIPRQPVVEEIALQDSPVGIQGQISFFPQNRTVMGTVDYVYLNRGELDGLEVGSPLEVYRPAFRAHERARSEKVRVSEHVVAQLIVVHAEPESSVAFVAHTATELAVGDLFRAPDL